MLFLGYLIAKALVSILPLRVSYWLARRIADIWYVFAPHRRQALIHNLNLLPTGVCDRDRTRRLARRIMHNFAEVVTEFLYLPRMDLRRIAQLVDLESFKILKTRLAGRRALLITAHLGNWELGAATFAMMGLDLHVVAYDHPDRRIALLFRQHREEKGLKVLTVKESAKRIRNLPRASCIGIVADRDFTGRGTVVKLLGIPTRVPSGYAGLAISEGIPVIPGFCIKDNEGRYHLEIDDPIYMPSEQRLSPEKIVERFVKILEKRIAEHPEQWYFFERIGFGEPSVL